MKIGLNAIGFLFLFQSGSLVADDQRLVLRLSGFPTTEKKCQVIAGKVARQFEIDATVKVLISKCLKGEPTVIPAYPRTIATYYVFDIELTYIADEKFNLIQSEFWSLPYHSYEACMQGLNNEKEVFESITGLNSIIGYCSHLWTDFIGDKKKVSAFRPVFYGLGVPKAVQKTITYELGYLFSSPSSKIDEEIFVKSKTSGINIQKVLWNKTFPNNQALYFNFVVPEKTSKSTLARQYLFKMEIESRSNDWLTAFDDGHPQQMESGNQCLEQLDIAKDAFSAAFNSPVIWFCNWDIPFSRARLAHLRIKPGSESFNRITPGIEGEPFLNEYPTRDKCEQDKVNVLAYYRNKLGENLIGALCSFPFIRKPQIPIKMFMYAERNL